MAVNQVGSLSQHKNKTSEKHKVEVENVRDDGKLAVRVCEPDNLIPFQSRVVWSPLFDERPPSYQFSSMHGLKRISSGKFSDAELPAGWKSAEQKMRQLIPYSSDVKICQELISCQMRKQYLSSSDEERPRASNVGPRSEGWGKAGMQQRKLYSDISESKESSSDSNGNFLRGGSRYPHGTVASTSSGCMDLVKHAVKKPSRTTERQTKTTPGTSALERRPWNEGGSGREGTKHIAESGSTFTFTSSRSNKRSEISRGKTSPTNRFGCKTGGTSSAVSGGIGRGRIPKGSGGKENEEPEYPKRNESSPDTEDGEKATGVSGSPTYNKGGATTEITILSSSQSSGGGTTSASPAKIRGDATVESGGKSDAGSLASDFVGGRCQHNGEEGGLDEESLASVSCSTVTDVEKDRQAGCSTRSSRERRSRRRTRKRCDTPAEVVASAASMIGNTVEAVRRVRKDAAELAYKLAELHAHDAKALRSAAAVMCEQVDQLQDEIQEFEAIWWTKEAVFPWQDFVRELFVTVSLISGAFSLQTFLSTLRRAARDGFLKQTVTRKEKMIVAAVVLSLGARFGNGVWQGLNQVASSRQARQAKLSAQFKAISQRVTMLSAVSHSDPTIIPIPGDRDRSVEP